MDIKLGRLNFKIPNTLAEFKSLTEELVKSHGNIEQSALLYYLTTENTGKVNDSTVASMVGAGKIATLHLLYEALGAPNLEKGFIVGHLSIGLINSLLQIYTPFLMPGEIEKHPNLLFLQSAKNNSSSVSVVIINRDTQTEVKQEFLTFKTTAVFELFNQGSLRGSDPLARQALLDSFSILPNRRLNPSGEFCLSPSDEPHFIRTQANYNKATNGEVAGIDKFPSLLATRSDKLMQDGNRIVPGAMIRDGVYVGKRNIFMFHVAVNIAAAVGDDNLIDSHASIASSAQIGNRNKIGSFVSLEGVLSPANADPVYIGDDNFLGTFARIGTGIRVGNNNFIGAGVNISLGTKLKDCRTESFTHGNYVTVREINENFNGLAIMPNNATREFEGVDLVPGEYILSNNNAEFMARFEGDSRIKGTRKS